MISFEAAYRMIREQAQPLAAVQLPLLSCRELVLGEDVHAPCDLPRFDSTAVDGFAVKLHDVETATPSTPVRLPISRTMQAGQFTTDELRAGTAWRVLTGAALPKSVEAVVMQEFTTPEQDAVVILRAARPGEHIRRAGEECRASAPLLARGTPVTPPITGLLSTLGLAAATVIPAPRVTLIITGDELRPVGQPLEPGLIHDSNGPALSHALTRLGVQQLHVANCRDDRAATLQVLRAAIGDSDLVVTVGGASVGQFDFVADALRELGVQLHYQSIAIKPGKPNLFGTIRHADRDVLIFGLPGNPVSALLSFQLLVRPAIRILMARTDTDTTFVSAVLSKDLKKKPGRLEFVRVALQRRDERWIATPTTGQDSHMLSGLSSAHGLLRFPPPDDLLPADSVVQVELLAW